ncbi:MAG: glycoside hydrolase family 97 protein [Rikenellaceae bacterium]|nr:glycoside hydrolase family 97 protein [Rikenellaceae bacterium]
MQKFYFLFACISVVMTPISIFAQSFTVTSPDKSIVAEIAADNGKLTYYVSKSDVAVIEKSGMGLLIDGNEIGNNVTSLTAGKQSSKRNSYRMYGMKSNAQNYYNGREFNVADPAGNFTVEIRVFNSGVAFKYSIENSSKVEVSDITEFKFPANSTVWVQDDIIKYEGEYKNFITGQLPEGLLAALPVTAEIQKGKIYAAVLEGGLVDFGGMRLKSVNGNFSSDIDGKTILETTIDTSWRIIAAGSLTDIVNCDIPGNVSPEMNSNLFGVNTNRWLIPGKGVWSKPSGYELTPDNMKKFTDYAVEMGFSYNLVDEGWEKWTEENKDHWDLLKELVDYSKSVDIGIWITKSYREGGMHTAEQRKAFLDKCREIGIAGVKVINFDGRDQEIVKYCQEFLYEAAQRALMVSFYDTGAPTGSYRTYPNEISGGAVRNVSHTPDSEQTVILPFTRYTAGYGDYSPFVLSGPLTGDMTLCRHLATIISFTSPVTFIFADPRDVIEDDFIADLLFDFPTVWDETVVLEGTEMGKTAFMARRYGDIWYIVGMTTEKIDKINLDLSILGNKRYNCYLITDDPADDRKYKFETVEKVDRKSDITIDMNRGGGFVAKLVMRQ